MEVALRDLQMCEYGILKEIKRICEKHHITYYLSSGTLLGAVRHEGFIPWDDDIDVEMPYPDYVRFLEIAQTELGDGYFVQNSSTEDTFHALFTKVMKNGTTMYGEFDVGLPGHHGVWVDVFPLIYIGGKADLSFKRFLVRTSNYLTMDSHRFDRDTKWIRSRSNSIVFAFVKMLRKLPFSARKRISKHLARTLFRGRKEKARMAHVWQSITYVHPASVFDGVPKMLRFEDDVFSCPFDPEEYLRNAYGDFMKLPPEDQRNGGHGNIVVDLEHSWDEKPNG